MSDKNTNITEVDNTVQQIKPIDADMPAPETKDYIQYLKLTPVFISLLENTLGQLPYATILSNRNNDKIKLIDLVSFIETKHEKISINELEEALTFIGNAPFKYVRPLMEIVDNKERHHELWSLTTE